MTIEEHVSEFAGLAVESFDPEKGIVDPTRTTYRLSIDYETEFPFIELLARFLEDPNAKEVTGIVIGAWQGDDSQVDSEAIVEALVAARDSLPKLRAIFLGDITREENEISWIVQSDITSLFDAYPALEYFRVRGGSSLVIGTLHHENLKSLVVETGGLDAEVVRGIISSNLPKLEHLELWMGSDDYGGNVTVADLEPILNGDVFPALIRLGIRNCEIADQVAKALATAPVVRRLKVLDLSMGNLSDEGALELLKNPAMAKLEILDIHFHYVSEDAVRALESAGIKLNSNDRQEPDVYKGEANRYIAVSE